MISKQMAKFRKNIGYTQQQMASLLNMSQQGYAHYESGETEPNIETIKKLCIIFDCSIDELLDFDTDAKRNKIKNQLTKN